MSRIGTLSFQSQGLMCGNKRHIDGVFIQSIHQSCAYVSAARVRYDPVLTRAVYRMYPVLNLEAAPCVLAIWLRCVTQRTHTFAAFVVDTASIPPRETVMAQAHTQCV
jgi:hypothetical protein